MKRTLLFAFLVCFSIAGCKKTDDSNTGTCVGVNCGPHGYCNNNICTCETYWLKDANGQCTQFDCGTHGNYNTATASCECDPGWNKDLNGRCTLQDLCYQVDCGPNGQCNPATGDCDCDPGYTTDTNGQCNVELRNALIGTWRGSHTDDFGNNTGPYVITITPVSGNVLRVKLSNFMDYWCSPLAQSLEVYGEINPTGSGLNDFISLCSQWNTDGTFDGATLIDPTTLNIRVYLTTGGGGGLNLNGTYFKQ